jgi:hypothetical protein
MTTVRAARRLSCGLSLLLALPCAIPVLAADSPSLRAVPHQKRVRSNDPMTIVPLWDTTWWVTIEARRGTLPLEALEYHAKFTDVSTTRVRTGEIELHGDDREGFTGRLDVACPVRPDYTRPLRLRLRLREAGGATGEWVEVRFPVRDGHAVVIEEADAKPLLTTESHTERRAEPIGTVEVEVDSSATIAKVREALQKKAVAQGGDALINFRLAASDGDRTTFTAEAVRYIEAAPPPTPTPTAAPADRVLGEIRMHHER